MLVLDDVITAGTAMRETMRLVANEGGKVMGFVVALDRIETIPGLVDKEENNVEPRMSAMGQIRRDFAVQTASIATLNDLIAVLRGMGNEGDIERLEEYRRRYLASDYE